MNLKEIKKLNWVTVSDWRELTISYVNYFGQYVGKEDIDIFVEKLFKKVAKKLDVPYEQLEPILKEENAEFYTEEKNIFEKYDGYTKEHWLLLGLKGKLKVPDVEAI